MITANSAKEIPEQLLLSIIESLGQKYSPEYDRPFRWTFIWDIEDSLKLNGIEAPPRVLKAKLAKLIKQGVLDGCVCGCRGDFWVKEVSVLPLEIVPVVGRYR